MSTLRILGLVIGIIGLFLTLEIYRGVKWKKTNFLFFSFSSIVLIIISINPDILNLIVGIFALEKAQYGRIIFLLIFSTIFLWFLNLSLKSKFDDYKNNFDLLIRSLGQENAIRKSIY